MASHIVREVDQILFGVYSSEELRRMSVVEVTTAKMSGSGSVYDDKLGTISDDKDCETCGQGVELCSGHFGHIELNESILHPLYHKRVVEFLKCICINCHRTLLTEEQLAITSLTKYKGAARFQKVLEKAEKNRECCRDECGCSQPEIKFNILDSSVQIVKQMNGNKVSIPLTVDEIFKIFDAVPDSDVVSLGLDPKMVHPRNLVMQVFPVIPTSARPFIISEGNICDDDLTIQLCEIIKANISLKKSEDTLMNEAVHQKALQTLKFRISTFFNNSQAKARNNASRRPIKGIKERIVGKGGQIRHNLMGKRALSPNTPVLLWNGLIVPAKEVKIGTEIIGDDGEKRSVINVVNGWSKLYSVVGKTGRSYTVSSGHILTLREKESQTNVDIHVEDFLKLSEDKQEQYTEAILDNPINWELQFLKLDPYLMGLWLGDPNATGEAFTHKKARLSNLWMDWGVHKQLYTIPYKFTNNLVDMYRFKPNITQQDTYDYSRPLPLETILKTYNLSSHSVPVRIPPEYMLNSIKNRRLLVKGIIDSSDLVFVGKMFLLCKTLIQGQFQADFKYVCGTLGLRVLFFPTGDVGLSEVIVYGESIVELGYERTCSNGILTGVEYSLCNESLINNMFNDRVSVTEIGEGEFYGFEIDENKRFLLGDFTITHNCDQTARTVIGPDPTLKLGELAIPPEFAETLTVPVKVTAFNIDMLDRIVNDENGANRILKQGNTKARIVLKYALVSRGTRLIHGDIIVRGGKDIPVVTGREKLEEGDEIRRGSEIIKAKLEGKKRVKLEIGDIVERKLYDGVYVLLNRQPTLHKASMQAMKVVIREGRTLRFNLAINKSFNADFDRVRCVADFI